MFRLSPHEVPARKPLSGKVRRCPEGGQGAPAGSSESLRQGPERADTSPMRRLVLIVAMLALGSTALAQGVFEYWKAGAHTKRSSRSPLPRTTPPSTVKHAPAGSPGAARPAAEPAWTEAWFADRGAVRRQIGALRDAIAVPMIGERYPLPRGGGFRCSDLDAAPRAADDPEPWAMRCSGTDAGLTRENFFVLPGPNTAPVLVQVCWAARASSSTAAWRSYYRELADTLSRAMGQPVWVAPDSMGMRWERSDHAITLRLHVSPAHAESLEVIARSSLLPMAGDAKASARP